MLSDGTRPGFGWMGFPLEGIVMLKYNNSYFYSEINIKLQKSGYFIRKITKSMTNLNPNHSQHAMSTKMPPTNCETPTSNIPWHAAAPPASKSVPLLCFQPLFVLGCFDVGAVLTIRPRPLKSRCGGLLWASFCLHRYLLAGELHRTTAAADATAGGSAKRGGCV